MSCPSRFPSNPYGFMPVRKGLSRNKGNGFDGMMSVTMLFGWTAPITGYRGLGRKSSATAAVTVSCMSGYGSGDTPIQRLHRWSAPPGWQPWFLPARDPCRCSRIHGPVRRRKYSSNRYLSTPPFNHNLSTVHTHSSLPAVVVRLAG